MPHPYKQLPRRILFVDHTSKVGGGEIALLNLVRNLDKRLVHPIVLLFADGPLVSRMQVYAETHVLPLSEAVGGASKDRLGWRSLLRFKAALLACAHVLRVGRLARKMRVDLIHTNSLKADILGGIAGRLVRIPVIWHVRDRIDPDYLPGAIVPIFRRLSRIIPNYVIANSGATLATLHLAPEASRARKSRSRVVHDGCDVDPAKESRLNQSGPARIGLVGRISPWKGQDIFLRAAALLRPLYPAIRFEMIGAALFAEREYEAYLHELCSKLELSDAVEFAGFVEDVPARMAQLDIVVHASTIGEPFGQVIIEAMAEQKPVVATNGGGVPEIVEDGVSGLLVPMGDAVSMAQALKYLLDHPQAAARMGLKGKERVLAHFSIQRTARMVESIYDEIVLTNEPSERERIRAAASSGD